MPAATAAEQAFDDLIPPAPDTPGAMTAFDDLIPKRQAADTAFDDLLPGAALLKKPARSLSTTAGGPRVRVSGTPFSETLAENDPWLAMPGVAVARGGRALTAAMGDLASLATSEPGVTNLRAFAEDPETPTPVEQGAAELTGLKSLPTKATVGLLQAVPAIGASAGLSAAGVPGALAAALPMTANAEGDLTPGQAAMMAALPGVSALGEQAVAKILSKLPAEAVVEIVSRDPMQLRGRIVQKLGGIEISNDLYRQWAEAGGGLLAANAFLVAANAPEILALPAEQRQWAILDQVAGALGPSLIGFAARRPMSQTAGEYTERFWRDLKAAEDARKGAPPTEPAGRGVGGTAPEPKGPQGGGGFDVLVPEQAAATSAPPESPATKQDLADLAKGLQEILLKNQIPEKPAPSVPAQAGATPAPAAPAQPESHGNERQGNAIQPAEPSTVPPLQPAIAAPESPPAGSLKAELPAVNPKEVNARGGQFFRILPETAGGGPDILNDIQQLGGLQFIQTARNPDGGEWNGHYRSGSAAFIYKKGGLPPDLMLQGLREMGHRRLETVDDMWNAIRRAAEARRAVKESGGTEEQKLDRFWQAIDPETKKGLVLLNADQLAVGDVFYLRGKGFSNEALTVTHVDADNGDVTVKDGTTFGTVELPAGTEIWAQRKGLAPEQIEQATRNRLAKAEGQGAAEATETTEGTAGADSGDVLRAPFAAGEVGQFATGTSYRGRAAVVDAIGRYAERLGFEVTGLSRSGFNSVYLDIRDPETGKEFTARFSGHERQLSAITNHAPPNYEQVGEARIGPAVRWLERLRERLTDPEGYRQRMEAAARQQAEESATRRAAYLEANPDQDMSRPEYWQRELEGQERAANKQARQVGNPRFPLAKEREQRARRAADYARARLEMATADLAARRAGTKTKEGPLPEADKGGVAASQPEGTSTLTAASKAGSKGSVNFDPGDLTPAAGGERLGNRYESQQQQQQQSATETASAPAKPDGGSVRERREPLHLQRRRGAEEFAHARAFWPAAYSGCTHDSAAYESAAGQQLTARAAAHGARVVFFSGPTQAPRGHCFDGNIALRTSVPLAEIRETFEHELFHHRTLRGSPAAAALMDAVDLQSPEARRYRQNYDAWLADHGMRATSDAEARGEMAADFVAGVDRFGVSVADVFPDLMEATELAQDYLSEPATRKPAGKPAAAGMPQAEQRAGNPTRANAPPGFGPGAGPVWRDNILDALATWQNKGTPEQLRAHLAKHRGAMDEAEWLGLDEWLAGKTSVSRAEAEQFVRGNRVVVKEVTKGKERIRTAGEEMERLRQEEFNWSQRAMGPDTPDDRWTNLQRANAAGWSYDAALGDAEARTKLLQLPVSEQRKQALLAYGEAAVRHQAAQEKVNQASASGPKFANYQLPGGANYRELLLTLPAQKLTREAWEQRLRGAGVRPNDEGWQEYLNDPNLVGNGEFKSHHWEQPNVLAHVRFNERTDADGRSVLFIEEIQSDWHQQGRKHGYTSEVTQPPDTSQWTAVHESRRNWDVYDEQGRFVTSVMNFGTTARDAINEAVRTGLTRYQKPETVPDAPFKQTWPMLAFKRMLRWAAEHGFDRIAWTTGEQQAERYDLSKQVDQIRITRASETDFELKARRNGETVLNQAVEGQQGLADMIGKELAARAVAEVPVGEAKDYHGSDLRVGGKGMRKFYDDMLPSEINKFVKRWGARVGQTELNPSEGNGTAFDVEVLTDSGNWNRVRGFDTEATAQAEADQLNGNGRRTYRVVRNPGDTVHSLDLTPALREAALGGLPIFAPGEPGDLFRLDAPESVAEQKARLKQEALKRKQAEELDRRQQRRLTGEDLDTTAEMVGGAEGRETRRDASGQGALFAPGDPAEETAAAASTWRDVQRNLDAGNVALAEAIRGWMNLREEDFPGIAAYGEARRAARARMMELTAHVRLLQDELRSSPGYVRDLLLRLQANAAAAQQPGEAGSAARLAMEDITNALQQCPARLVNAIYERMQRAGELPASAKLPEGPRTLSAMAEWIARQRSDSPHQTLAERLRLGDRAAEAVGQARELGSELWRRVRGQAAAAWDRFLHPITDSNFRTVHKEFIYTDQYTGLETKRFVDALERQVPNPLRQQAISIYNDAGGDEGLLRFWADSVPERFAPVFKTALKLTPFEKQVAERIRADFADKRQAAIDAGFLQTGRDDYGMPQIWRTAPEDPDNDSDFASGEKKRSAGNPRARLDPRDPFFSLQRTHPTYFDGIMAKGVPADLRASRLAGTYNAAFHKALNSRAFIWQLKDAQTASGEPVVKISGSATRLPYEKGGALLVDSKARSASDVTADGRRYQPVNHWALRDWKFVGKGENGRPILVRGEFLVHPDAVREVTIALDQKSALRDPNVVGRPLAAVFNGLLSSSAFAKASLYAGATFHGFTLAEHMLTHALAGVPTRKRLGLLNVFATGVEMDPAKNPALQRLMRGGLKVAATPEELDLMSEGLAGSGGAIERIPGVGEAFKAMKRWLFEDWKPRAMVKLGEALLEANDRRYGHKYTPEQIAELTADEVAAALGGQNTRLLLHSKTFTDFNRLVFGAPDFLLSRAKVVGTAFQPWKHREQTLFLLAQAVAGYVIARLLNKLLDDDWHAEPENAFAVIMDKRRYSARLIVQDVQHLATDPKGFAAGRVGPWPRALYEGISERDMRTGARIEPVVDVDSKTLRSAEIALQSLLRWGVPVSFQGLLPDAPGREETGPGQFALAQIGVGSRKYTSNTQVWAWATDFMRDSDDPATQLARKAREEETRRSAYRKLDALLDADKLDAARSEYAALQAEGRKPRDIHDRYHDAVTRPFTGTKAREARFVDSLTAEQRAVYQDARKERQERYQRFLRMARGPAAE